ncbi:NAD(P)-dependent oxidoreductase [Pseudoflavonifractor sp. 524-17]|uniref:NAD(P)-dependent oxidoreductase n=1 Tax=Pseudoflavonifractor sp. 524-17 TaxID=2304577 RepID=UPI00137B485C|nr:NAD(P)-dependent oxidoreductase [Pseudoflavonifractor sp. 524-17]NCE65192.1 NAD(P)-dependent oxidoreductase [Pseudoflavonifractor sp. 524-17]
MDKLAWIGAGVMGRPMAAHLAAAGYPVAVYTRRFETLAGAEDQGLLPCATIAQAVEGAKYVFVMVGYPQDVEEVFTGPEGIFRHAAPGTLCIDMTTSSPALAEKLSALGAERGIRVMDAPVSGGDSGARNATLSIMAGGSPADFEQALPLFRLLGKSVHHMGPAGSGQHTKAANQIAVAGATAAYTEALVYAQSAGLDPQAMLDAIGGGAAGSWQIANMAPRVLKGDLAPGFFIKHFIKDMKIIQTECAQRGVTLEMLNTVCGLYESLAQQGLADEGTQALIRYYQS